MGVTGVLTRGKEVLLVRRRHEPFAGSWMFPAGFVEYGEHPDETLKREIREETGLEISSFDLIGIFQSEDDPREPGHLSFCFKVNQHTGVLQNDEHENHEVKWFAVEDPPEICFAIHKRLMHHCQVEIAANIMTADGNQ